MKKKDVKTKMRETDVDRLARMVAQGFAENKDQLNVLTKEVVLHSDMLADIKNIMKSHQQMLMDHEHRLDLLES